MKRDLNLIEKTDTLVEILMDQYGTKASSENASSLWSEVYMVLRSVTDITFDNTKEDILEALRNAEAPMSVEPVCDRMREFQKANVKPDKGERS